VAARGAGRLRLASESQRTPLVPNGVMGMLIFVATETMLFAGMISAFTIIKSSSLVWPLTSSNLGAFFYLIVGLHALHAVIALGILAYTWVRLQRGWLAQRQLAAAQVFWYFVVGLWPVLYAVVYL